MDKGNEGRPAGVGPRIAERGHKPAFAFLAGRPIHKRAVVVYTRFATAAVSPASHVTAASRRRASACSSFAQHAVGKSEVVPDFAAVGAERDRALQMLARVDRRIVVQARGTETDPHARIVRRERHAFGQHLASGASGTGYLERVAELVHQIHVAGMAAQAFTGNLLPLRRLAALKCNKRQHLDSMQ